MDGIRSRICSIYSLNRAFMKRKSGRMWKPSVMDYYLHMNRYNYILNRQLASGTYHAKPRRRFHICDPKPRDIEAPHLVDGIVQSSVNANHLNERLRYVFLQENCACQKGKGTDYARNLFKEQLRRYFRRYGRDGVVLKIDIKSFFASIDGDALHSLNERYIEDGWVVSLVEQWGVPQGGKGLGLGAETNQTESCIALHPIDVFLKTVLGCRYMVRYQDDIMLVLRSRDEAHRVKVRLAEELAEYKLSLNVRKTQTYRLCDWYPFLGFRFTVADSGRVLMKIRRESVSRIRRRAKRQAELDLPSKTVEDSFTCWRANASKGDNRYIIKRTEACIMEIVRNQRELEKQLETALARIERLNATIEYLAMMSDVDISQPTETSHGGETV